MAVRTDNQLADLLTKPLPDNLFQRFRDKPQQLTRRSHWGRECDNTTIILAK